jgi:hypothetical protein
MPPRQAFPPRTVIPASRHLSCPPIPEKSGDFVGASLAMTHTFPFSRRDFLIRTRVMQRMIPKSGHRFSDQIMRNKSQQFQTAIAAIPTFVRSLRQWRAGTITIGIERSRVSPRSTRHQIPFDSLPAPKTRFRQQKGSRTPRDAVPQPPRFWRGARLAIRARLSAFHCGSRWAVVTPQLSSRPCILGLGGNARSHGPPFGEDRNASPRALPAARLSQSRVSTPAPAVVPEG